MQDILEKSRKFKKWIVGVPPDADLFKEYMKEISRDSFLQSLPGKIIRYSVFGAVEIAAGCYLSPMEATISGFSMGAFDTFLLDKLTTGWRPNQYINHVKTLIN